MAAFGAAAVVLAVAEIVAGNYVIAVAAILLAVVAGLRAADVSLVGSAPAERPETCPRCGGRALAPDVEGTGVRHCSVCGADVGADVAERS